MKRRRMVCRIGLVVVAVVAVLVASVPCLAVSPPKSIQSKFMFFYMESGQTDKIVSYLEDHLAKDPTNLELMYGLAAGYAQKGNVKTAMKYVKQAVDGGLPVERFIVGPRNILRPLTASPEFKQFLKKHPAHELLDGPMLGAVTDHSARFWIRTIHETPFTVRLSRSKQMAAPLYFAAGKTSADEDFTGRVEVGGLEPDTTYYYQVVVGGHTARINPQPSFQTYPRPGTKTKFRVAFGGGSNNKPEFEYMWDTILLRRPQAFLGLGDNNYYDMPEPISISQYCYYQREARPEWRRMTASTPTYAIWDDHDFAGNDSIGGPQIDVPAWKRPVWHVFKDNWNNPSYGGGEKQPGCWYSFSIGDVDFFMLDCRYYRTDPEGKDPILTDPTADHPSMLGPVQQRWLLKKLAASTATFKVIASSVPWAFNTKTGNQMSTILGRRPGFEDTWQGFPDEREAIFSFIEKHKIEGVFLLSADRHRSDAWRIKRPNGYDFYEAMSSHLTKNSAHPAMPGAIFTVLGPPAYGLLTFDTTLADPEITYNVVKIDNSIGATMTFKKSQLSFKNK